MIKIVGAGLAGCEAAHFLLTKGAEVELIDMKPLKFSPAHRSGDLCELVCSNSLKSNDVFGNACGLLKEEMRRLGSVTLAAAAEAEVPAGGALAVDREKFSSIVTKRLLSFKNLHLCHEIVTSLPMQGIVATGPLTDDGLAAAIRETYGGGLHFYDASAPIVAAESIDLHKTFTQDRYGVGTGDYLNCPMTKEEYESFVFELVHAARAELHDFEKGEIFEGCMPVEVMAARGKDTLRFGTFKPVGLTLADGTRPYAVLQLRKENAEGTSYNLVGCQTNLKFGEQKRVFSLIPALKNAEFLRYGVMHRNTYLQSPEILNADFSAKNDPMLFFAGQMTGVEGYVESAASGLMAGIHMWRKLCGGEPVVPSARTVIGALSRYIATPNRDFQPMNANYGVLEGCGTVRDKKEKRRLLAERSLAEIDAYAASLRSF